MGGKSALNIVADEVLERQRADDYAKDIAKMKKRGMSPEEIEESIRDAGQIDQGGFEDRWKAAGRYEKRKGNFYKK